MQLHYDSVYLLAVARLHWIEQQLSKTYSHITKYYLYAYKMQENNISINLSGFKAWNTPDIFALSDLCWKEVASGRTGLHLKGPFIKGLFCVCTTACVQYGRLHRNSYAHQIEFSQTSAFLGNYGNHATYIFLTWLTWNCIQHKQTFFFQVTFCFYYIS